MDRVESGIAPATRPQASSPTLRDAIQLSSALDPSRDPMTAFDRLPGAPPPAWAVHPRAVQTAMAAHRSVWRVATACPTPLIKRLKSFRSDDSADQRDQLTLPHPRSLLRDRAARMQSWASRNSWPAHQLQLASCGLADRCLDLALSLDLQRSSIGLSPGSAALQRPAACGFQAWQQRQIHA